MHLELTLSMDLGVIYSVPYPCNTKSMYTLKYTPLLQAKLPADTVNTYLPSPVLALRQNAQYFKKYFLLKWI